ncbi:MAG: hypothetical protein B6U65_01845 [Candidatus Wolframiiraptor sp. EX4484-121]|nr:MAG: hypothetical protein B6U65_01845 [Candidatus Wolframiiraptor sp. EX4484-121]
MSDAEYHEYRCMNCGATLKVTPETIVAICEYCGAPNIISGILSEEDLYLVPSVGEGRVWEEFWRRVNTDVDLKSIASKIRPVSIEGSYIPFWLSRVELEGEIIYRKREYYGKQVRVRRVRESFSRVLWVDIVARRQVKHLGLRELVERYLDERPESIKLSEIPTDRWREIKLPILNLEYDRAEAEASIRDRSIDLVREEWEGRVSDIIFFSAEVKSMTKPNLVFLPIWTITYRYGGGLYFAQHDGWSGRSLVFAEPIRAFRRAIYILGMISSTILGGLSGYLLLHKTTSLGIFILIASISLGYLLGRRFVSDVRIERG